MGIKLTRDFYLNGDVVDIARQLLGKCLMTQIGQARCGGIITETEAYNGIVDKASHAYGGKRSLRTEVMYAKGGTAYVYLCYGMHHLFNVVTNKAEFPHAVLIRAIYPCIGTGVMMHRRNKQSLKNLCPGPGTVSQALSIRTVHTNTDLTGNTIWLEDIGINISQHQIITSARIGVDYAGEDALLPYRFAMSNQDLKLVTCGLKI